MKRIGRLMIYTVIAVAIWNVLDYLYYTNAFEGVYHFTFYRNLLLPVMASAVVDVFTLLSERRKDKDKEKEE